MKKPKPSLRFFSRLAKEETEFDIELATKLLLDVTSKLDREGIPYHLEGGTLLGIVRDNEILPWDDDLDISVPAEYESQLANALTYLFFKRWRIDKRRYHPFGELHFKGSRVFKIRDRCRGLFSMGHCYLDIFLKQTHNHKVYWQAKKKLMAVSADYYSGFEFVEFKGHKLKAPVNYKEYLTEKYGDWQIPVQNWDCSKDEKTIVA